MAPDPIPYIIAMFVRAILYGLYIASLAYCLRWLILDDHGLHIRRHPDYRVLTIIITIFIFVTTCLGIIFRITIDLIRDDHSATKLMIAKIDLDNTAILITSAVLIWRCWVINHRTHRWFIVCLPIILWFLSLVCSNLIVYYYATFLSENPQVDRIFSRLVPPSRRCWLVFYLCDIVINVYATCGIIYKINKVSKNMPCTVSGTEFGAGSRKLSRTSKLLALFGSLYTLTTILSLISLVVDSQPRYDAMRFSLDALNFLMPGITFNLIQIVVHKERANAQNRYAIDCGEGRTTSLFLSGSTDDPSAII